MAYEGELLEMCPDHMFDFTNTNVVIVSGAKWNPWGHALLNTGGFTGNYFQVVGEVVARPRYMSEAGYRLYLKDNGKKELKRYRVHIPEPEKSQLKLEEILSDTWKWGVIIHNCETLVEEIIVAGGGPAIHSGPFYNPTKSRPMLSL